MEVTTSDPPANKDSADSLFQSLLENVTFVDMAIVLIGIIANSVVLSGVNETSIQMISHRRFLTSLLGSNIFACGVNFSLIVMTMIANQGTPSHVFSMPKCVSAVVRRLGIGGFIANLLSLMALAVDHFIGIIRPIQYKTLMNNNFARRAVFIIWILAFIVCYIDFPIRTAIYYAKRPKESTEPTMCNHAFMDFFSVLKSMNDSDLSSSFNGEEMLLLQNLAHVDNLQVQMPCAKLNKQSSEHGDKTTNWCDQFGGGGDVWLQGLLVVLAIGSLAVLAFFVKVVSAEAGEANVDPAKRKLRRLIVTAFLLLGTFFICWAPLVAFEIAMVFIAEIIRTALPSQDKIMFVHNIVFSLFKCSSLFLPFIYAARNRAVRRQIFGQNANNCSLLKRYRIATPARRDPLLSTSTRTSTQLSSPISNAESNNKR